MSTTKFKIESGMQLFTRLIKKPEIGNFYPNLFQTCPNNGDIIEISCESGSPLLIDIISEVLVSQNVHGSTIGIILFNTDGNFNYDILLNTIRKKLLLYLEKQENNISRNLNVEGKFHETLNNFHILEINSALQLYTSIHNLENILMKHSNISLVIFDTLTAFYWSEQGFKITKMESYIRNLLQLIKKVSKEYKVTCIYTTPHYFNSNKDVIHIEESWVTKMLNYSIQITKCKNDFQVNVRTNQMEYVKQFQFKDDEIKWH